MTKILIVDDDEQLRKLVKQMFERLGESNIECASGGQEGLAMLRNNSYQLVMLDLNMPSPNGIEFLVAMSKIQPGIPCIFMTAAVDEMVDAAMVLAREAEVKMLGALHKPFNLEQLQTAVEKLRAA